MALASSISSSSISFKQFSINLKVKGKLKRRGKILGRTKDRVKVIITLDKKQNLDDLKGIFN